MTDQTVSDNGPQFISNEFRENSVNTFTAPPTIHPQRFVRSCEEAMTACDNDNSSLDHRIDNFCTDPQQFESPVQLLLGHNFKAQTELN